MKRPPILVCVSLALFLILAAAIYVLAFYSQVIFHRDQILENLDDAVEWFLLSATLF